MKSFPSAAALAAVPVVLLTITAGRAPAYDSKEEPAARGVADALDRILQPRFQEDAGIFGISRLVPFVPGHNALGGSDIIARRFVIHASPRDNDAEKRVGEQRLLDMALRPGNDFVIGFLHIGHTPGQYRKDIGISPRGNPRTDERLSILAVRDEKAQAFFTSSATASSLRNRPAGRAPGPQEWETRVEKATKNARLAAAWEQTAKDALPRLKRGSSVNTSVGDYMLVLRPVQAKQASCLGCHTGATPNETLGVLVYAVARGVKK